MQVVLSPGFAWQVTYTAKKLIPSMLCRIFNTSTAGVCLLTIPTNVNPECSSKQLRITFFHRHLKGNEL
ncbi:unnamed protein product [Hymenolepis diminuta]|uniref:Uncharacterized protein n=1 Tax=Hymenolepis diminuta TaxID=6216 RepID=A0A564YED2_HYMDI|nr:unnamed protein product [Hymenolepis diminuta]VUZ45645.1 unnamed protein product [Hymenolepis diminuta]VUZ45648.1 unnamed protein product [Hymenolepis diminuta]